MPGGLFRKEEDRWVVNLPNPPASAVAYHQDHARLLVRYMFLMTPDEQRALSAAGPAATAGAPVATTQNHARAKRRRSLQHHWRSAGQAALGRRVAHALSVDF
jgi:hypothetical protein